MLLVDYEVFVFNNVKFPLIKYIKKDGHLVVF
ncbi:hypothetical protein SAMN05443549_10832 [Flavobacterium fluvii]|uniref:Uncharacterized protein n=1 Tax=Flavobacterium fluvii TaxID=468056 RepID=A0A1M5NGK5_9FLAO|nr:hypothetical protein SAMN05443549_10832 [Flavobacterium fluvii]